MRYRAPLHLGPQKTPKSLKVLILITIALSLASAFIPSMRFIFSLSWIGASHFYFWQFLTYPLIAPTGVSFSLFLLIAFNMYLLWAFGTSLIERSSAGRFFTLYFGASAFAGLCALLPMAFGVHGLLAGSTAPLYAVLIAWVMLNPESELLLFFTLPIKAVWLIFGLLAANLVLDASNGDWVDLLSNGAAAVFGYFYALAAWRELSHFSFLNPFEKFLFRSLDRTQDRIKRFGKKRSSHQSKQPKIYDINSGEPLVGDEQFMDAMLERISLRGEDSLTPEEKKRMQAISAKKSSAKK